MRAVFRALSEDEIRQAIDHIHVCVRYRDTNRLMAVNALMIDDVSSHRVIRIAE
jgi:hypothetical protein